MTALRKFEGQDVIGARVEVTNAGDGLSDAMTIDPEEYPMGTELTVVMKCVVAKVRYQGVPKTDSLVRVHTLKAGVATIVSGDTVSDLEAQLDAQVVKLEEAKGQARLDGTGTSDDIVTNGDPGKPRKSRRKGPDETPAAD